MSIVTALAVSAKEHPAQLEPLWTAVQRLIASWANRYHRGGETRLFDAEDLIQAGYLALYDAVCSFDPEKGEFTTHLRYHVRYRFAEVAGIRGSKRRPEVGAASLNAPLDADGEMTLLDTLRDPSAAFADTVIERESLRQDAAAMLAEIDLLPERQREAVRATAWEGQTLTAAADRMGIPLNCVRQYREQGLRKIRGTRAARRIGSAYYHPRHVGLREFQVTRTSEIESHLIWLEEMRERVCLREERQEQL